MSENFDFCSTFDFVVSKFDISISFLPMFHHFNCSNGYMISLRLSRSANFHTYSCNKLHNSQIEWRCSTLILQYIIIELTCT